MNVRESIEAVKDGTFEEKIEKSAQQRAAKTKRANSGAVQKGRDLFESMNKKEM